MVIIYYGAVASLRGADGGGQMKRAVRLDHGGRCEAECESEWLRADETAVTEWRRGCVYIDRVYIDREWVSRLRGDKTGYVSP